MNDTTPKVTGIGGIFFLSKDPAKTKEWYGKNLGLAISEYGSSFEFRNANRPEEINYLQWSPFEDSTEPRWAERPPSKCSRYYSHFPPV